MVEPNRAFIQYTRTYMLYIESAPRVNPKYRQYGQDAVCRMQLRGMQDAVTRYAGCSYAVCGMRYALSDAYPPSYRSIDS
jgi:hypothetical protein